MNLDPRSDPPEWWDWPLAFIPHVELRMEERGFSEVELRTMLSDATRVVSARRPGRFVVFTHGQGAPWCVVVEPDANEQLLYAVTAFPKE